MNAYPNTLRHVEPAKPATDLRNVNETVALKIARIAALRNKTEADLDFMERSGFFTDLIIKGGKL